MKRPDIPPFNNFASFPGEQFAYLQFATPDEILAVQNKLLADHVEYAALHSPFYRALFYQMGLDYREIRTACDLLHLPLIQKHDLLEHNLRFLAVDRHEVVDVCLTSATTGVKPAMLLQTAQDIARLAYNEALAFDMAGITSADTLLVIAALDRGFMAGLAYFLGGIKLGALTVRGGAGSAEQNWHLIHTTGATAIVGVPSMMRKIAEYALSIGESPAKSPVRKLVAIGESLRDAHLNPLPLTESVERVWDAKLYATYASTESATSFCECRERKGGHLRPELIVAEIIGEDGKPVEKGQIGEVVVTPLGVKGMPLLRFCSGDISFMIEEPCGCGRTTPRIGPVLGRKNQMLKLKGTTLFPTQILSVLDGNPAFYGGYVEASNHPDGTDQVILHAALNTESYPISRLQEELRAKLRVVPVIHLVSRAELDAKVNRPDKSRKKITFFDSREVK